MNAIVDKMDKLIKDLRWRYAVKRFDTNKKITPEVFNNIKEVLRLVPTSNGLQPYKFIIVETPEVREELKKHSFNQPQITEASHLIVFCSYKSLTEEYYDRFIELNSNAQNVPLEELDKYAHRLKKDLLHRSDAQIMHSNEKQCYIALGQLLQAAAYYRVDASPIEGFQIEKYNEVLGLDDQNITATVVCALGYRSEEDDRQHWRKVRKDSNELFDLI